MNERGQHCHTMLKRLTKYLAVSGSLNALLDRPQGGVTELTKKVNWKVCSIQDCLTRCCEETHPDVEISFRVVNSNSKKSDANVTIRGPVTDVDAVQDLLTEWTGNIPTEFERFVLEYEGNDSEYENSDTEYEEDDSEYEETDLEYKRNDWEYEESDSEYEGTDHWEYEENDSEYEGIAPSSYEGCYNCGLKNHNLETCRYSSRVRCHACNRLGHKERYCRF